MTTKGAPLDANFSSVHKQLVNVEGRLFGVVGSPIFPYSRFGLMSDKNHDRSNIDLERGCRLPKAC